ncbi:MAG TPA: hypothetical protein VEX66_07235 [Microlunatus sp.]|jgi:hypothetical protein|nr:hypothetical protein [Microlunatus sp.]
MSHDALGATVAATEGDRAGDVLLRILAAFFALTWLILPWYGLIDLSVTLFPDPEWQGVLEGAWGLYLTVFIGVPFLTITVRGRTTAPAIAVLYVATIALAVSGIVAAEAGAFVMAVVLGLETVIVTGPPSALVGRMRFRLAPQALLIPFVLGAVPWSVYAWTMWSLNRQERPERDITNGVDHYSVQGSYALALLALVALAEVWPAGRLYVGCAAGSSAVLLGLISWAWHPSPGSFDHRWSALCVGWGLTVLIMAYLTRQRRTTPALPLCHPQAQT